MKVFLVETESKDEKYPRPKTQWWGGKKKVSQENLKSFAEHGISVLFNDTIEVYVPVYLLFLNCCTLAVL